MLKKFAETLNYTQKILVMDEKITHNQHSFYLHIFLWFNGDVSTSEFKVFIFIFIFIFNVSSRDLCT
jgi:hypothetical protein